MAAGQKPVLSFARALWVVGASGAGKSTLARSYDLPVVETGKWSREQHAEGTSADVLTASALACLGKDHRYFSRLIGAAIREALERSPRVIVVGCRNPTDFSEWFDPHRDGVLFLKREPVTHLERWGIPAIESYVEFLLRCGVLAERSVETRAGFAP
jgi:hypothetical protein